MAEAGMHRTIPALPVREMTAAVAFYAELAAAGVLHPVSRDGVDDTDFGTREFATLDRDGNLISFFRWES